MRIEARNDLDLRLLEAFAAVIAHGTTPAAAAHLGISQSAVWNALRSLEARLGLPLFNREGRRLVPTAEALAVHAEVAPLLGAFDGLAGRLRALRGNERRRLRIAATSAMGGAVVPPALRPLRRAMPDLEVALDLGPAAHVAQSVALGLADFGLMLGPVPRGDLAVTVLGRSNLVAILPRGNMLASRTVVGPADLQRFALIGSAPALEPLVEAAFGLQGIAYAPSLACNRMDGVCALVHAGLGVAVVDVCSAAMSRGLAVVIRRFAPVTAIPAILLTRPDRAPDALHDAFAAALAEAVEALASAGRG